MSRTTLRNYIRNSIRFRAILCLLVSVALGLILAWLTELLLEALRLLPAAGTAPLEAILLLALVFSVLILIPQVSVVVQPIANLNERLRRMKSREDIRRLDPDEFVEMGKLLKTVIDYIDWAENQQTLSAAIHHAFRKRIEHLAEYDPLTGLYNRYYLKTILPLQIAHMTTLKDSLSGIMLDVDNFKLYNDANGHPEGDKVLAQVAEIIRSNVREQDICCRYGGEEFFVALPNANCERALVIAERIRQAIEQTPFAYAERQPKGRLTASLGVASCPTHAAMADELIECADQAMYLAKRQGRDRTCVYDDVILFRPTKTAAAESSQ
jgi:diguanylate cyclase (GGDEF)-like protein